MPEFTVMSVASVVIVLLLEHFWFRSGIYRMKAFWISYVIVLFFESLVDGWLTKLSAPIVIYDEGAISGVRVPFDVPIEDFLFGFTLLSFALIMWVRSER